MTRIPSFPTNASIADVYKIDPDSYGHWMAMGARLLEGPSAFTVAERELMGAFVSALNACQFCVGLHGAIAEAWGIEGSVLEKLVDDIDTAPVRRQLKPVFKLQRKLTLEPSKVVDGDAQSIFDQGWDEAAYHDAVSICCRYSYMNRLVDAYGLAAPPAEKLKEIGAIHRKEGYAGLRKALGG